MAGRGRAPVQLSPEFIAALRRRYVETDQPVRDITAEFGISQGRLNRLIESEGWPKRQDRPPRQLPAAVKLLEEARMLSTALPGLSEQTGVPVLQRTAISAFTRVSDARWRCAAPGTQPDEAGPHTNSDPIARIEQLVVKEIAAEEAVRARLGIAPREAADAERSARTLSILTQTLQNLQRLRAAAAGDLERRNSDDDNDMPAGLDEFRRALARRIEAFVASQPDDENVADDRAPLVAAARP